MTAPKVEIVEAPPHYRDEELHAQGLGVLELAVHLELGIARLAVSERGLFVHGDDDGYVASRLADVARSYASARCALAEVIGYMTPIPEVEDREVDEDAPRIVKAEEAVVCDSCKSSIAADTIHVDDGSHRWHLGCAAGALGKRRG